MTDTCKEHSYFLETRSPGLVGRITEITDKKVFYKIYKRNGRRVVLIGEDSWPKDGIFQGDRGREAGVDREAAGRVKVRNETKTSG